MGESIDILMQKNTDQEGFYYVLTKKLETVTYLDYYIEGADDEVEYSPERQQLIYDWQDFNIGPKIYNIGYYKNGIVELLAEDILMPGIESSKFFADDQKEWHYPSENNVVFMQCAEDKKVKLDDLVAKMTSETTTNEMEDIVDILLKKRAIPMCLVEGRMVELAELKDQQIMQVAYGADVTYILASAKEQIESDTDELKGTLYVLKDESIEVVDKDVNVISMVTDEKVYYLKNQKKAKHYGKQIKTGFRMVNTSHKAH